MAGEASDWQPIKEDMVNAIGRALDSGMTDFDISAAMPAFFSQRISVMSRGLLIGHEVSYHT